MGGKRVGLGERLREEVKLLGFLSLYLGTLLVTFTTYKRLLMTEYGIPFFQYGYSILEALVLAKFILLGRMLRLGERFRDRPLIVVTLYKTFCFGLLVLALSALEHFLTGWLHGHSPEDVIREYFGSALWEALAKMLIVVAGFVPLFGIWELGRYLDLERVLRLFVGPGSPAGTKGEDLIRREGS